MTEYYRIHHLPERNLYIRNAGERWSHGRAPDCQSGAVVQSHLPPFRNLEEKNSIHICLCLSEETLKAGGPFYLVSMPGEVKDPTQGVNM